VILYNNTVKAKTQNQNDKKIMTSSITCSACRNNYTDIITDPELGETVCSNCGIVITEKFEDITNAERRAFTTEEKSSRSRTGAPTSLAKHDKGLATIISKTGRDASGQKLDAYMHSTFKRLRTWDLRTQYSSSTDRNLVLAFSELDILKDKLGLSDALIEKVAYIYRKAQERRLTRGRSITGMLAAAIYIACRDMGTPRTLKDVVATCNVKRKDIARNCRLLIRELDIRMPMTDPMKCIIKVASKANLSEKITRRAMKMMTEIIKKEISAGKHPMSFAATVLYISSFKAGEKNVTQLEMAKAAGVTEVTIRNRIRELNSKVWQYH
jgi:transcription initiation factor TFIIB